MNRIDVECPECGILYHLLASSAGKPMQCPNKLCGATFVVPLPAADAQDVVDAEIASRGASDPPVSPDVVEATIPDSEPGESSAPALPTAATPSAGDDAEQGYVEAEIADVPPSEVETLPSSAVVRGPLPEEASARVVDPAEARVAATFAGGDSFSTEAAARPAKPAERRPRPRRPARRKPRSRLPWMAVATVAALLVGILLLAPHIRWDLIFPNPETRWSAIMQLFDEKKWDRVVRELDGFEQKYPDSPHVEEIPFFRDLCRAGRDVYSPTGDADRGLELLQRIFRDHRDNPAYAAYCGRLYDALARLVTRLAGKAVANSDLARVARARQAHDLLTTVGQASSDEGVAEQTAALALAIDHAELAADLAVARQTALERLDQAKSPQADVDPDQLYAEIDRVLADYAARNAQLERLAGRLENSSETTLSFLADLYTYYNRIGLDESIQQTKWRLQQAEKETSSGLIAAYKAEPGRVRFLPQPIDLPPLSPDAGQPPPGPQGSMVAVVWGDNSNGVTIWNDWNYHEELARREAPSQRTEVVFALARGILYAFDTRGTLRWARRLGIDSHRLPRPIDSVEPIWIAVSTEDNTLIALEEATGRVRWTYPVGQNLGAPLMIVQRTVTPDAPARPCGLLPTADGEIHVLELVLGKPLGRYEVGQPLTVGGTYDPKAGVVFFPADSKRIFAIDPAAIDDPGRPACRAVLFTNHPSGALRSEPAVVGPYLIVSEASELEHTRLRAFEIRESGILEPTDPPRKEVTLQGWTWFEPHCTPDRITLITDQGHLGVFGLNLDNPDEALYRIVPDWNSGRPAPFRALAVHAEEHLLWIMAGGLLEQLAVDVVHQQVHSLWQRSTDSLGVAGFPVHEAQTDRFATRFFLATMSSSGDVFQFTAVHAEDGNRLWQRQLGLNLLGDPIAWEDGAMLIDRSGRTLALRSDAYRAGGQLLPQGADEGQLIRLGDPPGSTCLLVPSHGGTRLAIREVGPAGRPGESEWAEVALPVGDRLHGRPCLCGDFVVAPCSDGQLRRIRWRGQGRDDGRQVSFSTGSRNRVDLVSLSSDAIVMIDGQRHLRRLELRTEDGVTRWEQVGREFEPDGETTRLCGRTLPVGDRLFVCDTQGAWYALDARNPGRRLAVWALGGNVTRGPVLRGSQLLAVLDDRRLICLAADAPADAEQPLWASEPFEGRIRGMPVVAGDTLLVADNSRQLTGIRLADGKRVWSTRLQCRVGPSATPVPCADDKMLVPLSDGTLLVMPIPSPEPAEGQP